MLENTYIKKFKSTTYVKAFPYPDLAPFKYKITFFNRHHKFEILM